MRQSRILNILYSKIEKKRLLMQNLVTEIKEKKLIAIIRGVRSDSVSKTVGALLAGGINLVEITFDQTRKIPWEDTAKAIELASAEHKNAVIGAGTVVNLTQLELAVKAGARFILAPDVNEEIIRATKAAGLVSIPGAMTPSECGAAMRAGADFVKLFPAGNLGSGYLKAIKAPLSDVPVLCVGGINEENIPEFLKVGAAGFGIGSNLVSAKLAESGDFEEITRRAKAFVAAARG